jgi:PKD repeat protein
MKRLIYLSVTLLLALSSCEEAPEAAFSVDNTTPEVGEAVLFTNQSFNAESFDWDFGDNSFSNDPDPVHIYTSTGTYQVTLTAFSKSGTTSQAFMTISVKNPTLLEVEVLEYYSKDPVQDASIILYPTLADWDAQTNSITEGFTDENGIAVFSGLGNFVYYLDVWQEEYNNYALRDEDVNFIRTPQVKPHQITRFVAYVDYVSGKGSSGIRDRKLVVKKLIPRRYTE